MLLGLSTVSTVGRKLKVLAMAFRNSVQEGLIDDRTQSLIRVRWSMVFAFRRDPEDRRELLGFFGK